MLKALYDAIRNDAAPEIYDINGRKFSAAGIFPVEDPRFPCMHVCTLTGVVDYLRANVDGIEMSGIMCHVDSPSCVTVVSKVSGGFLQRHPIIRAYAPEFSVSFNRYMDGETFNIMLQSCFVDDKQDTHKDLVLKFCGNTREIAEGITVDDGITQAVNIKRGLSSVETAALPNPVTLRPYRTFLEVDQPASKFVFRAKEGPQFMLTEADGGAWKNEAMQSIKAFMQQQFPDLAVIA